MVSERQKFKIINADIFLKIMGEEMRLALMVLLFPVLLARGAYESVSKPIIFDTKKSRHPIAFSYPTPALSHRNSHRQFIPYHFFNSESLRRGKQGMPLAKVHGRTAAKYCFLSLQCQKSNSEPEPFNKTTTKSWETAMKQRMEGLDFSLMKNDLSLISIYSLGDSIVEVGKN